MSSLVPGSQRLAHHGCRCEGRAKRQRPRHLHESTIRLGDTSPCYTTVHNQSYSGRSADGRPLIFCLREPSFPSQHGTCLDLRTSSEPKQAPLLSHSREVYRPKHISPSTVPKDESYARYRSGRCVREIANPNNPSEYGTTYTTQHTLPQTHGPVHRAGGRAIQWHQHDILTGEQRSTCVSVKTSRGSRDRQLWDRLY